MIQNKFINFFDKRHLRIEVNLSTNKNREIEKKINYLQEILQRAKEKCTKVEKQMTPLQDIDVEPIKFQRQTHANLSGDLQEILESVNLND